MSRLDKLMHENQKEGHPLRNGLLILLGLLVVAGLVAHFTGYDQRVFASIQKDVPAVSQQARKGAVGVRALADGTTPTGDVTTSAASSVSGASETSAATGGDDGEVLRPSPLPPQKGKALFDELLGPVSPQFKGSLALNAVYDLSREGDWNTRGYRRVLEQCLFTKACRSKITLNFEFLTLSAAALDNANLLILPMQIADTAYSKEEKKLVRAFLERGGSVLCVLRNNDRWRLTPTDFLGDYGGIVRESSTANLGHPIIPKAPLRGITIERGTGSTEYCLKISGKEWKPLIVDSSDETLAYAAVASVGKGHVIYASDAVAMGWRCGWRPYNAWLWAELLDALAQRGKQVDPEKPFDPTPPEAGTVRYTEIDHIPIYAAARYRETADKLRKDLDAMIPHISNEWGVAYQPLTNTQFLACGCGVHYYDDPTDNWGGRETLRFAAESTIRSPLESYAISPHTVLLRWMWCFEQQKPIDFTRWIRWDEKDYFGIGFRWYLLLRAFQSAGRERFAQECRAKAENMCPHWQLDGWFKAYDQLAAEDPTIFRKFLSCLRRHVKSNDLYGERLTNDQVAKMFSEALYGWKNSSRFHGNPHEADAHVHQIFATSGLEADPAKARFEKPAKEDVEPKWSWEFPTVKEPEIKRIPLGNAPALEMMPVPEARGCLCGCEKNKEVQSHTVTAFWMARDKVSDAQWREVMKDTPYATLDARHLMPTAIREFCRRLNTRTRSVIDGNLELRLPTEMEWEIVSTWGRGSWHQWQHNGICRDYSRQELDDLVDKPNTLGVRNMLGMGWEPVLDTYARTLEYDEIPAVVGDQIRFQAPGMEVNRDPLAVAPAGKAWGLCRGMGVQADLGYGRRFFRTDDPKVGDLTLRLVLGHKIKEGGSK